MKSTNRSFLAIKLLTIVLVILCSRVFASDCSISSNDVMSLSLFNSSEKVIFDTLKMPFSKKNFEGVLVKQDVDSLDVVQIIINKASSKVISVALVGDSESITSDTASVKVANIFDIGSLKKASASVANFFLFTSNGINFLNAANSSYSLEDVLKIEIEKGSFMVMENPAGILKEGSFFPVACSCKCKNSLGSDSCCSGSCSNNNPICYPSSCTGSCSGNGSCKIHSCSCGS